MINSENLPVSVNICTYNEEKSIADCLKSVIKNNPKEIIVIDGGSTDATVQISESMGAKVLISENNGLSSQRQHGIENSNQPFIAIVDADDNLENNFLQILYHELIEYNYDALLGRQVAFEPVTYWEKAMGCLNNNITYTDKPIDTNMVGRPALYKKEPLLSCGFDSFFDGAGCEDTDLSIRMENAGFRQGIGTGMTRRKQSPNTSDIIRKIIKYGRGDARIVKKYPHKLKSILYHQLINYPIVRSYKILKSFNVIYVPFYLMMGLGRFFSMIFEYVRL